MSCNGCRVLRKGCSENCILRPCLEWIDSSQAQAHATVFVAKFFGRAGLMSFISSVPEKQRSALFQSLLFEACGRTISPVSGAVGLLWTGNWHVCQAAVQSVLRGNTLQPMPEFLSGATLDLNDTCKAEIDNNIDNIHRDLSTREQSNIDDIACLGLSLSPNSTFKVLSSLYNSPKKQWYRTPSMNSEESETTTCYESFGLGDSCAQGGKKEEMKLLNLFT